MADLSEYEALNGIEFSQEVKQLMELFAESWEECRADECRGCKYRHGKKLYQLLFCLAERYADKLISNGYAQVRHGRWEPSGSCEHRTNRKRNTDKWTTYKCSECGFSNGRRFRDNFCPNCGAKMDKEVEENGE